MSTRMLRVEVGGGFGIATSGRAAGAAATTGFSDHQGTIITAAHLQLIYWGRGWSAGTGPTTGDVDAAARSLVTGTYLTGLAQYRGIGPGQLLPSVVSSDTDPPNPFREADVVQLLRGLIEARRIPESDDDQSILYCVMLPPGVAYETANIVGQHSYFLFWDVDLLEFDLDLANACHYAWVTSDGTLGGITTVLSHELAEAVTDPEGTAILGDAGVCDGTGWCEIGDVCETQTGVCDGVTVQAYWSQQKGTCIVSGT